MSASAHREVDTPGAPLLIDVSHTSRCTAPTGVQRVSRAVCLELERRGRGIPVAFDRLQGAWRGLRANERRTLDAPGHDGPRHRFSLGDAAWAAAARMAPARSARRGIGQGRYGGLLVVEKLESRRERELVRIRPCLDGPSVAVLHDLIPVKFPEFATRRSLREFGGYLDTLRVYDGVAAVSEASRRDLIAHWSAQGVQDPPPVAAIPPATDPLASLPRPWSAGGAPPMVLMVGTLEPRKNQRAALDACETLWRQGMSFALRLIGRRRGAGDGTVARIDTLRARGRPVEWRGHVSDRELDEAYAQCRFTLCPSLYEGYGLPAVESLRRLRPSIVSERGGLAEVAAEGGCLVLPEPDADSLAAAIRRLLEDEDCYRDLASQCARRRYRDWKDYVDDLGTWMDALARRVS